LGNRGVLEKYDIDWWGLEQGRKQGKKHIPAILAVVLNESGRSHGCRRAVRCDVQVFIHFRDKPEDWKGLREAWSLWWGPAELGLSVYLTGGGGAWGW